jgi:hypothetical protein
MNQSIAMLAILVALGMAGSSLTTILPWVYAQTSSGQAGSSSPPISGASPPSSSAPSQQGSEHVCPPGTTSFSQGQCTVTTTTANQCPQPPQVPSGYTATGTGQGTCTGNVCPSDTAYSGSAAFAGPNAALCQPTASPAFPPIVVFCPSGYTLNHATGQCTGGTACPPGTTLQGQSCVTGTTTTRPGQGNQR